MGENVPGTFLIKAHNTAPKSADGKYKWCVCVGGVVLFLKIKIN